MTFPKIGQSLKNPNVFVGDAAHACHGAFSSKGMTNVVEGRKSLETQTANSSVMKPTMIGDIKGMLCDASGNELTAATFTKVRCSSANAFNFFLNHKDDHKWMEANWEHEWDKIN